MQAYQSKITKVEFVAEMKRHQEADSFMRRTYGKTNQEGKFRGCSVGCGVESLNRTKGLELENSDHEGFANALGIPGWVTRIQDILFENMSVERYKSWSVEFAEAIQEGTDLDEIKVPLLVFILEDALKDLKEVVDCEKATEEVIAALKSGNRERLLEAERAAAVVVASRAVGAARVARLEQVEGWAQAWALGVEGTVRPPAVETEACDRYADKFLELARGLKPYGAGE